MNFQNNHNSRLPFLRVTPPIRIVRYQLLLPFSLVLSMLCASATVTARQDIGNTTQAYDATIQQSHRIQKPTNQESAQIKADLRVMLAALSSGDVDIFVEKTHPALFPLLGGKANFIAFTTEALKQLDTLGVKMISNDYEHPGRFYSAGEEMLSIVPRTSVMEIKGQTIRTIGFMVAIKNTTSNTWRYLDGSGLREDKSMLWEMFPELDTALVFPENKVEIIE